MTLFQAQFVCRTWWQSLKTGAMKNLVTAGREAKNTNDICFLRIALMDKRKLFSKSLSIASAVSMFSYRRYLTRKSCHANAPFKRWKVGFFLQHSSYIRLARRLQTTAHGINPAQENISLNMKNNIFTKNLLIQQIVTYPETITICKMSGPRTVV